MFGANFRLFNLFGIEIRINPGWGVIAALVAWSLAQGVFPNLFAGLATGTYWVMALITVLGLAGSIILHELSHALMAARFGTPVSSITLFMFGGVAALNEEPKTPKAELYIALAGPAMSLALAGGFYAVSRFLGEASLIASVSHYLGLLNLVLALFNLLPAFPMDGGRALRAGIWATTRDKDRATRYASRTGKGFGSVFMALGLVAVLLGNFIGGLWWVLIGGFIRAAAIGEYESLRIKAALAGERVRTFMTQSVDTVPINLNLRTFVDKYLYVYGHDLFPVIEDGCPVGTIELADVKAVPQHRWGETPIVDVMKPLSSERITEPRTPALEALSQMSRTHQTRLLVISSGQLAGMLVLKDLLDHLNIRLALETAPNRKSFHHLSRIK